MASVDLWLVTWRWEYHTWCLDADNQSLAESIAIRLAEAGRTAVRVTPHEMEIDPAHLAAVKERIWKSVSAYAMAATVSDAMREAAG